MHIKRQNLDIEQKIKQIIAMKYNLPNPAKVDLNRAKDFERQYINGPEGELDRFLDRLDEERRYRRS